MRESTSASEGAGEPPPGRRRPRRRARSDRRQAAARIEILHCAASLFRKRGYHGATVEEIAASRQMKKGNLYYYFKNKEAILFACHQYSLDRLMETLVDMEAAASAPDEKLRRLITAFVHTILDELHGTALFLDLEALSPAHRRAVVARRDRFDHGMRRIVSEGIEAGLYPGADAKLLSFAILGAVNWIPRWFRRTGPASSEEIADTFAGFLIAGLKHGADGARAGQI
ncbi:MAG: TetR family transcriptional regulator [Acidobacteria bacterium]|nr:TetR family transcriptional regulator [Acidobacteriota bacterium]